MITYLINYMPFCWSEVNVWVKRSMDRIVTRRTIVTLQFFQFVHCGCGWLFELVESSSPSQSSYPRSLEIAKQYKMNVHSTYTSIPWQLRTTINDDPQTHETDDARKKDDNDDKGSFWFSFSLLSSFGVPRRL
jgi:hypothetical protein